MAQAGRLDEADAKGRQWFDVAARGRIPLGVIWIGFHLARCAVQRGRPRTALEWTGRVQAAIDASGLEGLRPATDAVAAVAHGMLGDAAASARRRGTGRRRDTRIRVHRPRTAARPGVGADRRR